MDKVCEGYDDFIVTMAKHLKKQQMEREILATRWLLDAIHTSILLGSSVYTGVILLTLAYGAMEIIIKFHQLYNLEQHLKHLEKEINYGLN